MKKIVALFIAVLFVFSCVTALADNEAVTSAGAKSMRLKQTEGEVALLDQDGNPLSLRVNMRLYSGNRITTGEQSRAAVQLDDAKAVTLDENSSAEISQQKKELELRLKSGALYFNVTKALEADESFQISTSTMVLGIRGTSGIVEVISEAETDVTLLTGHAQITAWNGEVIEIEAGQRIRIIKTGEGSVEFQTETITEEEASELQQRYVFEEAEHGLIYENAQELDNIPRIKTVDRRPKKSESDNKNDTQNSSDDPTVGEVDPNNPDNQYDPDNPDNPDPKP